MSPTERRLLWICFFALLIAGALLADDFGQSWDERSNIQAGERSLQAYTDPSVLEDAHFQDYYHGPAFFMAAAGLSGLLQRLVSGWTATDARHFVVFTFYLTATASVYVVGRRLMSALAAGFACLLLLSQPVLFGHAFINLKDSPFLSIFVIGFAASLLAVDYLGRSPERTTDKLAGERPSSRWQHAWASLGRRQQAAVFVVAATGLALAADFLLGRLILGLLHWLLTAAYTGQVQPLAAVFHHLASESANLPLEAYLTKLTIWYRWVSVPISLGILALSYLALSHILPALKEVPSNRLVRGCFYLVVSALAVGTSLSMRTAGPFLGILVSLLLTARLGRRAVGPIAIVWAVAVAVGYATWPALWDDPLGGYWQRLVDTASFEDRIVRFMGADYVSSSLPWSYLPILLAIQLTLPVLPLALVGAISFWSRPAASRPRSIEFGLVAAWFAIPFVATLVFQPNLYDNIRQLLFMLPPVILYAGLGLEWLAGRIKTRRWRPALAAVLLAPGVAGIVTLHPFEYTYYNWLVGGVPGAANRFEVDYWCTSYRFATEWLTEYAGNGAHVVVWGPVHAAADFGRQDLRFTTYDRDEPGSPDFALACDHALLDPAYFSAFEPIHAVSASGVVVGLLKANPAIEQGGTNGGGRSSH